MKTSFVLLSIVLVLSSLSDASDFVGSPSQPPLMSPTSEPSSNSIDCSSVIYSMVDCLSYLTVGSTDPSPTKTCCGGIKTVLIYNPMCFCSALESSREMGFELDDTKALAMPNTCNVDIDPHCDVFTPAGSTPISPPVEPPTTSPPSSMKSPAISPSSPPVSQSSPPVSQSSPPVSHTSSPVSHSSPPVSQSSPARTVPSSTVTASSPAATSPSPSPSPSPPISSSGSLSVSKLFLAVVMVSSFLYILA